MLPQPQLVTNLGSGTKERTSRELTSQTETEGPENFLATRAYVPVVLTHSGTAEWRQAGL